MKKHDEPSADAATAKPTEIPAQEPTDQANPSDSDHQSQVEKEEHEHEVFDSSETNKVC